MTQDPMKTDKKIFTLSSQFAHKLKSPEELAIIIGPRPRTKSVIMCHGVFDVVHPGHLRHLLYAKSHADILVASLTADSHIGKAAYRPHIPQDLRALNLAAMEMVDYVVIDANPTPIENISKIQPDYFAKGYEYFADGLPPKTQAEVEALQTYGGELIFTPGDVVYSSSKFITAAPPALRLDKLLTLMEKADLTFGDLYSALDKFTGLKVHVVGDTIVDSYTRTSMIGGQTKTPTMSVLYEGRSDFIGGAGIVADHLRAAGAQVTFSTVLGEDDLGRFVIDGLTKSGVEIRPIIDKKRPTTNKNAIVAAGYRLLKIDTLDNTSISDSILKAICAQIAETPADAIVFSDFRHGLFNRRTIPPLIKSIPPGMFKAADSQVASRWGNITEFKGFDLITPNEREARFSLADQDSGVRHLASLLYAATECRLLLLKLGDKGMLAIRNGNSNTDRDSSFVVDSFVDQLVDAVGAGDALLAYATLAKLATGSEYVAGILGSIAAACECECDGNVPIAPTDVKAKLESIERQLCYAET
jgi:rfaE bifunctional protein kinase chain/domain